MNTAVPAPSGVVAEWRRSVPDELRGRLDRLREIVHEVAADENAAPVIEELKWGQPSFRSPHGIESTPIRLGWTDDGDAALLTHCRSRVIPEFRAAFGDRFRYDGTRAVLLGPDDDVDAPEIADLVRHALTYRRRR